MILIPLNPHIQLAGELNLTEEILTRQRTWKNKNNNQ